MPFKSQAQRRLFYAKMRRHEISPAKVEEWERETGDKKLPEHVKSAAFEAGVRTRLEKEALALPFSSASALAQRGAQMGLKGAKPMGLIGGGSRLKQRASAALAAARKIQPVTATYGVRI